MNELDEYYDDKEYQTSLDKRKKCYRCDSVGLYRYAPDDFRSNWTEDQRWRCEAHSGQYRNDCEWDYFPDDG